MQKALLILNFWQTLILTKVFIILKPINSLLFLPLKSKKIFGQKAKIKRLTTDVEKRAKQSNKSFNYIYITKYWELFFLDWYNNIIYAPNKDDFIKPLPNLYFNSSNYKFLDPEYLNQVSFNDTIMIKYKKSEKEWIAIQTAKLRK